MGSVQFSHSVLSDSLLPHGLQHTKPPCPSPTPRVYSDSCLLSRWCHPAISSSVFPFSSRLQIFPASGSFQMSQLFASGGQNIGVSAFTWFPLGWTGWISLQSKGLSRVFSNTTVQKLWSQNSLKVESELTEIKWGIEVQENGEIYQGILPSKKKERCDWNWKGLCDIKKFCFAFWHQEKLDHVSLLK